MSKRKHILSGTGSECMPHDPDLTAGDACFEWGGLLPGWQVVSSDCNPGYIPDEPDTVGPWVGFRVRTECKLDTGSGSGT